MGVGQLRGECIERLGGVDNENKFEKHCPNLLKGECLPVNLWNLLKCPLIT